jgi:hypothetical protein
MWAAGFFDGEGCIGIQKQQRGRYWYLNVQITQKDRRPLDRFLSAVDGLGTIGGPYERDGMKHRYRVSGVAAEQVLEWLRPWLSEPKLEQDARVRAALLEHKGI